MHLDPPQFTCPTHGRDLTDLVVEVLEEDGPPVAFRPGRRRGEFEVLVTCPGATPTDGPHQLACEGVYRR